MLTSLFLDVHSPYNGIHSSAYLLWHLLRTHQLTLDHRVFHESLTLALQVEVDVLFHLKWQSTDFQQSQWIQLFMSFAVSKHETQMVSNSTVVFQFLWSQSVGRATAEGPCRSKSPPRPQATKVMCWETSTNDPTESMCINRNNHWQSVKTKLCLLKPTDKKTRQIDVDRSALQTNICYFLLHPLVQNYFYKWNCIFSKEMEENAMQSSLPCAKVIGT